jgi:hypothetical protein
MTSPSNLPSAVAPAADDLPGRDEVGLDPVLGVQTADRESEGDHLVDREEGPVAPRERAQLVDGSPCCAATLRCVLSLVPVLPEVPVPEVVPAVALDVAIAAGCADHGPVRTPGA